MGRVCPGNNRTAGKSRSGRITKGDRWLRRGLTQAAWAASHTKGTYLSAQYRRMAARRGKKRALVALGHTILVIVYHILKRGTIYEELGGNYLDRLSLTDDPTAGQTVWSSWVTRSPSNHDKTSRKP